MRVKEKRSTNVAFKKILPNPKAKERVLLPS